MSLPILRKLEKPKPEPPRPRKIQARPIQSVSTSRRVLEISAEENYDRQCLMHTQAIALIDAFLPFFDSTFSKKPTHTPSYDEIKQVFLDQAEALVCPISFLLFSLLTFSSPSLPLKLSATTRRLDSRSP
jgi:hypothetical protein